MACNCHILYPCDYNNIYYVIIFIYMYIYIYCYIVVAIKINIAKSFCLSTESPITNTVPRHVFQSLFGYDVGTYTKRSPINVGFFCYC